MLSGELLEILCCPKCRGDLLYDSGKNTLTCRSCRKLYRVKNNIPVMIIDDEPENT